MGLSLATPLNKMTECRPTHRRWWKVLGRNSSWPVAKELDWQVHPTGGSTTNRILWAPRLRGAMGATLWSYAVGCTMPDPEGRLDVRVLSPWIEASMGLLVVYVDDFKMAEPIESMSKGWQLIASKLDMGTPRQVNRYLGCDHVQEKNLRLSTDDHPFAYLFDKSLPDPAAKSAAAGHRTQEFWEVEPGLGVYIRHHCQPRKGYFVPDEDIIPRL